MNAKNANGIRCGNCYLFRTNTVSGAPSQFQYRHMLSTITSSIDGSHGDCRSFSHTPGQYQQLSWGDTGIFGRGPVRSFLQLGLNDRLPTFKLPAVHCPFVMRPASEDCDAARIRP